MKIFPKHILIYISFWLSVVFLLISLSFAWDIWVRYDSDLVSEDRTVILLDVSRSMDIEDIDWNQSRLGTAKQLIESYIKNTNHHIWLSIFAWEWVNILPINNNHELTMTTLKWLDYRSLHLQWSRLDAGLESSIMLFWDTPWGNLIIFTDQDSYEWKKYTRQLQDISRLLSTLDIQVTLVWVGTSEWGVLEIGRDFWWQPEYLMYRWEVVRAPLEEDYLREVSQILWGRYVNYKDFDIWDIIIPWNKWTLINIYLTLIFIILSIISIIMSLWLLHKIHRKPVKKIFY